MNHMDDAKRPEAEGLKERFLEYFSVRSTNTSKLQETVKGLIDQGVTRQTLVDWAVQAGYSKGYVSSLLSRTLCSLGLRKRRTGGGRKPSADALELLAYSRERYGEKFLNVLRAAWRAGKARTATDRIRDLIVAPQLEDLRNYCGATIVLAGHAASQSVPVEAATQQVNNPNLRRCQFSSQ